jgi:trehalose/maltose hydrolase-like predicted phosphorylase
VTGDIDFVLGEAAEVMVETARMWIELGFFSERRDGRFCINSVTGPDEYTTVVNNNAYTNLMAKENLESAVLVVEWLAGQDPEAHERLVRATGLTEPELECWRAAAAKMYVPRHEELGIVLQDEDFLERKRWDFEGTPVDKYRCCCTTTRSSSIATRSSSRPTSCVRPTSSDTTSARRRRDGRSTTTTR